MVHVAEVAINADKIVFVCLLIFFCLSVCCETSWAAKANLSMPQAVSRALRFNPAIGSQQAQKRASEAERKSALGAFGPRLGMSYTVSKQTRKSEPQSARLPNLGTYNLAVEVSQPLFQGFRLLANYQKAALQADSDKASVRNAELTLTESVQTAFIAYLRTLENVRSLKESLQRLKDQLEITTAFYNVGLRPRLDVLQSQVDVSEGENLLVQAENNRETYQAQINTLLGFAVTDSIVYSGALVAVPFKRKLEDCLNTAYKQRPDLYIAAKAVEIAGKDQKSVQADYYPQIEAYYNVSGSGNTPDLQKSGANGSRATTWEVGARMTWEIFQWGTTHYADKRAGELVTKMRHEQEKLKLDIGLDVKTKFLALREAEKRIDLAKHSVVHAREAYRTALASYREQVGTSFDVLDASSKLLTAEASLTEAKADYLTSLAQLYTAMGEYHPDLAQP